VLVSIIFCNTFNFASILSQLRFTYLRFLLICRLKVLDPINFFEILVAILSILASSLFQFYKQFLYICIFLSDFFSVLFEIYNDYYDI
jgi:hypothetical protein